MPTDPTAPEDASDLIDTAPEGLDPEEAEHLDARDFEDEPWSDIDPEAAQDEEDGSVSFGAPGAPLALADVSTRDRWLQSALRALVEPKLGVDGQLGPRSYAAVAKFQRRAAALGVGPLTVDGVPGKKTIAALERVTQTTAPAAEPEAKPPRPAQGEAVSRGPASGGLVVRDVVERGVTVHHISAGTDEVSFSYWTPGYKRYKPYNVSRYKGAKRGLVSDADIIALGYSKSDIGILRANALEESGGAFGAINTWDDQIVSWGMAQFAGQAGTLAALLARLRESERTRASFERWFVAQGIDVARGEYPWKGGKTRRGWHVVISAAGGAVHRGNEGWQYLRTQPLLIGAFLLAGNDPAIQLGQIDFWRQSFLLRSIDKKVSFASGQGGAVRKYITSERGLAVLVRLHNWMPSYVVKWSDRFIGELEGEHPGKDLSDPYNWDQALEDAFVKKVCDERKRVKKGSYDGYALELSTKRGSYVGAAE